MALTDKLTAIADAIRGKTGKTEEMTLDQMATEIAGIETGGGGNYTNEQIVALIDGSITEFVIPNGMTTVGRYAFYYKAKLTSVIIPESCTVIDTSAFQGCFALPNVNLPKNLKTLQNRAFCECQSLVVTELPDTLETIGNLAITYTKTVTLTIPASVKTIGNQAFQSSSLLKSVTFNGKPSSIGSNAFQTCNNLITINVPWAEGAVANAPWGATSATINYNYTGG